MLYNFLLYCSLFSVLFLYSDAASYIGVSMLTTVAFTPIIGLMMHKIFNQKSNIENDKYAYFILLISIIILIFKFFLGQNFLKIIISFTIIPILISLTFASINYSEKKIFQNSMLFFFISETCLAIVERIFNTRFFDTIYTTDYYRGIWFESESWQFRSTSLLGHPLENAMAVSVVISFILFSNINFYKKILFSTLGYLSLFCFNARGAIIVVTLLFITYFIKILGFKFGSFKTFFTVAFLCIFVVSFRFISNSEFGGRLFNQDEFIDSSVHSRIEVFSYFNYLAKDKILYGDTENYTNLLDKLGIVGIENGVITAILLYGSLFAVPLFVMLFIFHWEKMSVYNKNEKLCILLVFWILGIMNPNLIDPTQWYIFILSYFAFRPYHSESFYRSFIKFKKNISIPI